MQHLMLVVGLAAGCGFPVPSAVVDGPESPATCTPDKVGCDGRTRRTCGADGTWDSALDVTCALTCLDGACVEASNISPDNIATCDDTAPALAPPAGAIITINTSGPMTHLSCAPDCGTAGLTLIDARMPVEAGAVDLAWFCLSSMDIPADVTIGLPATGGPTNAVAFIVAGAVKVAGRIHLIGGNGTAAAGGKGAPGAADGANLSGSSGLPGGGACGGKGGVKLGASTNYAAGGGGGGGYRSLGGNGGTGLSALGTFTGAAGAGGAECGMAELTPLVGGSGGGGGGDSTCGTVCGWSGGGGGGAVQISARTKIEVTGDIDVRGGAGYGETGPNGSGGGGGGGAGGAILIEAPDVVVNGKLIVDGGAGGRSSAGNGGAGATGTAGSGTGASALTNGHGGSGGGGAGGRIRINARQASCPRQGSPTSSCTAGPMRPSPL